MTLIATVFGAMYCLLLAIVVVIAAIRSQRTTPKIVYATLSLVLTGIMVVLTLRLLPPAPIASTPLPLIFSAAAPVPAPLTMYYTQNQIGSNTASHSDIRALHMTDGSTRFLRTYPASSNTSVTIDQINAGVLYIEELTKTSSSAYMTLKAVRASDGSDIWHLRSINASFSVRIFYTNIKNGVIYVTSFDTNSKVGSIEAISASDGSDIWQQTEPLAHGGANIITYDNDMLYVGYSEEARFLSVLQANDGKRLWQTSLLMTSDISRISVVAGVAYVTEGSTTRSVLHAVRVSNGTPLWQVSAASDITLFNGAAYAVEPSGALAALRITDGTPLWQLPDVAQFTIVNGVVYVIKSSGKFTALRATDGTSLWPTTADYTITSLQEDFSVVDNMVYVVSYDLPDHKKTTLLALRVTDGMLLWQHVLTSSSTILTFTFGNGLLYYGAYGDVLTALQAQDGSVRWQHKATDTYATYGIPTLTDGVLVVTSFDASVPFCPDPCGEGPYINVFSAVTGTLYWRYRITNPYVTSAITIADAV